MVLTRCEARQLRLFSTASAIALLNAAFLPTASQAQAVAPPIAAVQAQQGADASSTPARPVDKATGDGQTADIIVTGSRVVQNGYQAPTPVSVLSGQALSEIAPTNIADAVNRLPSLNGSTTPRTAITSVSSGALGVNQLNLRGLGSNRTLVLLDGKRVINASAINSSNASFAAPDVNTIPNGLVSRVEVVTGGASAAYGSDALAGVVNFVIDHKFTGIKGTLQGGVTTYGDDRNYLGSLTIGKAFADDKGHLLLSGEFTHNDGIKGTPRPWNDNSAIVFTNPSYTATNGQPFYLLARQIGTSNGTPGGLITRGCTGVGTGCTTASPIRGIVFGAGGQPGTFNFGTIAGAPSASNTGVGNVMSGGDWQYSRIDNGVDLDGKQTRATAYGRLSYDVSDGIELYAEGQYAHTNATSTATPNRRLNNLTITLDNPFIPAAVAAQAAALGLQSFIVGTTNGDIGRVVVNNQRDLTRFTVGADGKFGVLGSSWSYDAYYQHSQNIVKNAAQNAGITANYLLAVDAVRNPANGAIICRSTLTNPGNGCVPFNPLGTGVNTAQAISYVTGTSQRRDVLKQDVAAFDVRGNPFSTWAGPVAVAFGVEHRRESLTGQTDALDVNPSVNPYFAGNYHASSGSYEVTEGFFETEVPLARDTAWAKSLDFNGAVRETSYTTSGTVTTWKVGGTYVPVSDIRFRASHSRDIRAPNLGELYSAGQTQSGTSLFDPFTNTNLSNSFAVTAGNPNLKPETGDTNGVGVIVSPRFIPGFQASVDFYSIKVKNAVATPGVQQVVNLCFQGVTSVCPAITRTNGVITAVGVLPQNIASQFTKGLDFDVSYQVPLPSIAPGTDAKLVFRGTANYVFKLRTTDNTGTYEGAGVLGSFTTLNSTALSSPKFRSTFTAAFVSTPFDINVTWRHVGGGVYDYDLITCTSNCPASTPLDSGTLTGNTINGNSIKSNNLFDLGISLRPFSASRSAEIFLAVDNVFNKAPPLIYGVVQDGYYQGQSNFAYDRIGRSFRAGIRFKI